MKKLVLTKEETKSFKEYGSVEITRNGFDILVEEDSNRDCGYRITIINPYENIVLSKEQEEKQNNTKTILASLFDTKKMHVYDCKTTGKHPVHMIDGGRYLTESKKDFGSGDMGWFFLNQKEYNYFKSQLREIEIEEVKKWKK